MAFFNIEHRTLSNGEPRYKATVFVKSDERIVHGENTTFKKSIITINKRIHYERN
ncbi:hypothetical protein [Vibrio salinus]|uniref:hypothetical protein n=1 Tax=Vibrio salinus TaxID=2899784 RepID=UPI001E65973B|nr:hypothetical protein [Vibrio salinus]MCE0493462.1 hypothetical protein [Vibrio salinus]